MSYDLNLYRKDGSKEPFEREEIKDKLENSFKDVAFQPESGPVMDFELSQENLADSLEFHYQGKEKGCYWTYCSYGVDDETFKNFKRGVKEVATALAMQIQDVQVGEDLIDPEEFTADDTESSEKFGHAQKITEKVIEKLPFILPTKSKLFILYFITADEPGKDSRVCLTIGDGHLYASKVEVGESIEQVVKREVPILTGSSEYKLIGAKPHDTAKDRFGNELPRYTIYVDVPYFEPAKRDLKIKVEWVQLPPPVA